MGGNARTGMEDTLTLSKGVPAASNLQLVERLGDEYAKKYWIAWLGFFRPRAARVSSGKTVVVKVVPKADGPPRSDAGL